GTACLGVGGGGLRGAGLLVLVRRFHRDLIVWRRHAGTWPGPVGGAACVRPWHSALKDLLRLLLRPYFAGLALVGLAALIGVAARALMRPRCLRSFNPQPSTLDPSGRLPLLAVALLSSATVLATALIADRLLERMPHVQDSVAYLFQPRVFARGALWAPAAALPDFFAHAIVVRTAERLFDQYPTGLPALLAAVDLLG